MEVDDPGLDAFESATHAQLQARKLGKFKAFIPNLQPNTLVPESMGILHHDKAPLCCASSHEQSDLDESPEDLEKSTAHRMDFSRVLFLWF